MDKRGTVIQIIYDAVDEVNAMLTDDSQLEKRPDTVIIGKTGKLDSLGLVNFIVAVGDKIRDDFGTDIDLADKIAISEGENPFRTIETLTDYICSLLR